MPRVLNFKMSDRILFGNGALAELPHWVRQLGGSNPLLVTDPGLVKAGMAARVLEVLAADGITAQLYDRVEPDPRIEVLYDCLAAAKAQGADLFIGLGGGSSLDIAKLTSVLMTNPGDVRDYVGTGKVPSPGLPKILIPTTSGTGSEVTPIGVLSDQDEHLKKGVVSDYLYADVALIDPELTLGLPPSVTAYTGMDALTHAIEAYTNRYTQPFVDTFSLRAIELIGANLRRAVSCGEDPLARYNMALGSLYGGLSLGSVNTGAAHALAYPLGGTFNVPHGVANALLLPHVMRFNLITDLGRFARIAAALGRRVESLAERQAAEQAVEAVLELSSDIGIVSRLRDLNIHESAVDSLAEAAMNVTRLLNVNPRRVTLADAKAIYRAAW
jgi:alcohol dehydrogenase